MDFLEQHYIRWRLSDDPLAKGPSAKACYKVFNDITDATMDDLEKAWQEYQAKQKEAK